MAVLSAGFLPAAAQDALDLLFPTSGGCYARDYSVAHLATHPEQKVTSIALTPDRGMAGGTVLPIWVVVTVRIMPGKLEALAYCENAPGNKLHCQMEGDAGAFGIARAKGGAVLLSVSPAGMSFEGETAFLTLYSDRGDDRSFLLQPTRNCR